MVNILKKPKTKRVKLFKCPCGCHFTAEIGDFTFCVSTDYLSSYYTIACPFCDVTYIYPNKEVEDITIPIQ